MSAPRPSSPRPRRALSAVLALLPALLPILLVAAWTLPSRLNGDVRYALGGLRAGAGGGYDVVDTFVARPLAYRIAVDGLDRVRSLVVPDPHRLAAELTIRLLTYAVLAAIAVLLWAGLRRYLAARTAAAVALATGAALVLAPPWHFLEPDWLAVPAAVAAIGLALRPRRAVVAGVLAGLALAATVAIKIATFPLAIAAVLLIALVSRRRAMAAGIGWDPSEAHSAVYDTEQTARLFCIIANGWPRLPPA